MSTISALATGLSTGAALIMAIGAQNAFVLRQGLRRSQVGPVVLVCALSDALLIQAGVWGLGAAVAARPALAGAARVAGALFLLAYGLRAAHRAWRGPDQAMTPQSGAESRTAVVLTALALTWLNPHVYLDTVLLLGAVAVQQVPADRAAFAAGATLASLLWFGALGYGARWLTPWFASPRAWRGLDAAVALLMLALAAGLATPLLQGGA